MHDQYNDKSLAVLKKLSTIVELPGFVKEASVVDEKELHNLPRSSFGDPANRKFPVTSKKDAWLSSVYFRKNSSEYKDPVYRDKVKANIDRALDIWGIPKTLGVRESMDKTAAAVGSVKVRDSEGNVLDTWVLRSPRDFEKAAIQLFENKNLFTFEQRKDVARQLGRSELRKVSSLDLSIDNYLDQASGFGMCTKLQMVDTIRDRARMYKRADERFTSLLAEYAESLEDEELDHTHLEKTASVLDFLDKHTGVDKKGLPSPEECLFIFTEKTAEEIRNSTVRLQNGSAISKDKLTEPKLDEFFGNYLGEVPKVSHEEKIDILASLPAPDADDFEKFYKD